MRTNRQELILAAVVALLVAGCGAGGDGTSSTEPAASASGGLTVTATEFAFEPADLSLPAGQDTEVTLRNDGVVEHDITVDELDLEIYADAGDSVTQTVNVPAGSYPYYCSIPGHRQSGMEGTLTAS
jgi:plastocyanin